MDLNFPKADCPTGPYGKMSPQEIIRFSAGTRSSDRFPQSVQVELTADLLQTEIDLLEIVFQ